jgi:hypothetical protein
LPDFPSLAPQRKDGGDHGHAEQAA